MRKAFAAKLTAGLFTLMLIMAAFHAAQAAAPIVILNNDSPNMGFNDPTPVTPVGNNSGTTLGEQRLNAFQFAANIWGATLDSKVTITIRASWAALSCTTSSGTLGQAGATGIFRDFANAPFPGTWYSAALANALSGVDLDPKSPEISAQFNSNLGNTGCLDGTHFYLGLDNNHGSDVDLVSILMHEFAHGLGFQTFSNSSTGAQASGFPSIYDRFLTDNKTGKTWVQMTDTERQASAINTGNLVWNGTQTTTDVRGLLGTPRVKINSPSSIAGNYVVGTADFGARLSSPGVTSNVTQASPNDGCSALTNSGAIAGRIALIDRGNCNFVVKVKNAQNAGAVGVTIANNVASPAVIQMGGGDATITIPSVIISQADGNTIKGQLTAGISATLLLDVSVPGGADGQGRALMFAPSPVQSGSSVSHWDSSLFPNQLMEPDDSGDLTHSVTPPQDLTFSLLRDVGWSATGAAPTPNPIDTPSFFVTQHYSDFLNRQPDTAGLNFWTNEISSCADQSCVDVKRVSVSAAFYLSIEFQQTGYLVERVYKAAFGDATMTSTLNGAHQLLVPTVRFDEFLRDTQTVGNNVQVGIGNWQAQLETNKQNFAAEFVTRARFTSLYSNMPSGTFVNTLNQNAGFPLSAAEVNQLISDLSTGKQSRAQVLRAIAEHPNLVNAESNRAFVLMQYFGYLRRNPNDAPEQTRDYTGYEFWLTKLNQFNGNFQNAEMVKAFITSNEYRQRFGP